MITASRIRWLVCWVGCCVCVAAGRAAVLSDAFASREVQTNGTFAIAGSNVGASIEPREPRHADKVGGHSVWISWIAPSNGLATVTTEGSTFDTLLAVYTMEPGDDPPLARLRKVEGGDDSGSTTFSLLQFGALAGERYEIAVDGFAGATGDIELSVDLLGLAAPLPRILRQSDDRALRRGDTLMLTVDIQPTATQELIWFLNDTELEEQSDPTLVILNFQPTNAGIYRLRVTVGSVEYFSSPTEIQINSEGFFHTLARNKLQDALASGLGSAGGGGGAPLPGARGARLRLASVGDVTRGYNGTQIFNTFYASSDPGEPNHCGVAGGASYWFSYVPPQNGQVTFDTEGSDYDTLLAAYTFEPPLVDYSSLIPVTCDNNSGSNGLTSRIQFSAQGGRTYFIVVDGVAGAHGIAHLNYQLVAEVPPPPLPVITQQPQSQIVAPGNPVALQVVASGEAPLSYLWHRLGQPMTNQTRPMLTFTNVQPTEGGVYSVCVSNQAGLVFSTDAQLTVQTNPSIRLESASDTAVVGFPARKGYEYSVEAAEILRTNTWGFLRQALTDDAGMVWITNSVTTAPHQFYRLRRP